MVSHQRAMLIIGVQVPFAALKAQHIRRWGGRRNSLRIVPLYPHVAQGIRASGYEPLGRGFKSLYAVFADVAQLVEQGFCKSQVGGAIPSIGS